MKYYFDLSKNAFINGVVKNRVLFSEHNFCLIDFYSILAECEADLITNLNNYGLLNKKLSRDAKSLILHHIILQVCENVLKYKGKEKNVIYYDSQIPESIQLLKYYDAESLQKFLNKIVDKLKTVLPVRIYTNHLTFKEIISSKHGKRAEIVSRIKNTIDNVDLTQFSFSKTNLFTKRYNLTFLNKEYFNTIKAKQLLLT